MLKRSLLGASVVLAMHCAARADDDQIGPWPAISVATEFDDGCPDLELDPKRAETLDESGTALSKRAVAALDEVAEYLPPPSRQASSGDLDQHACDAGYKAFGLKGTVLRGLLKRVR